MAANDSADGYQGAIPRDWTGAEVAKMSMNRGMRSSSPVSATLQTANTVTALTGRPGVNNRINCGGPQYRNEVTEFARSEAGDQGPAFIMSVKLLSSMDRDNKMSRKEVSMGPQVPVTPEGGGEGRDDPIVQGIEQFKILDFRISRCHLIRCGVLLPTDPSGLQSGGDGGQGLSNSSGRVSFLRLPPRSVGTGAPEASRGIETGGTPMRCGGVVDLNTVPNMQAKFRGG
ncbi:hypothetical protein FB451DRAFT_1178834 [Mycena latifolia]|nr:hypothetical protein FB451DRAFT_1178834 [Mycena latifolia]